MPQTRALLISMWVALTSTQCRLGLMGAGLTAWAMAQQKVSFTLVCALDGLESAGIIDLNVAA